MLALLNDLTPVFVIVCLAITMTLEHYKPYFAKSDYRNKQRLHNIFHVVVTTGINFGFSALITYVVLYAENQEFGLLYFVPNVYLQVILGILLIDFIGYWVHRLYHNVTLFWRFHRVHHSDVEYDTSTAFRFHPLEFTFQTGAFIAFFPLLGMPFASFVIYYAFALPFFIVNHSNIKFPNWYEHYVAWILVTPTWHRIHHADNPLFTNSNYSDIFSFWDRIFGTHRSVNELNITFGLEKYRTKEEQTYLSQLLNPFKE